MLRRKISNRIVMVMVVKVIMVVNGTFMSPGGRELLSMVVVWYQVMAHQYGETGQQ